MDDIKISDIVNLDAVHNYTARMNFLLRRVQKDAKELKSLGVSLEVTEGVTDSFSPCTKNFIYG